MPEINGSGEADPNDSTNSSFSRSPPIIALTALAMAGDCDRCLAAGATAGSQQAGEAEATDDTIQDFLPENQPG